MGALANILTNIKESRIGKVIRGAWNAFYSMISLEEIDKRLEEEIEEAKKEGTPEEIAELNKIKQMAVLTERVLDEKAAEQFKIAEPEKDNDGFNKIPNKLDGMEATVSEEKAVKDLSQRKKGGKEKTRVDED